jgi:shikimate kinase
MVERRILVQANAGEERRPLARDPEKLRALYEARRAGYARADHRIEVHSDDCAETVGQIQALGLV